MLLGERVRNPEERTAVREIIERVMKVKIDPHVLYDANISPEITAYNTTEIPKELYGHKQCVGCTYLLLMPCAQ